MRHLMVVLAAAAALGTVTALNVVVLAQKKGGGDVALTGEIRSWESDGVKADAVGTTYSNGHDLTVIFRSDGSLLFSVGVNSGRRVALDFSRPALQGIGRYSGTATCPTPYAAPTSAAKALVLQTHNSLGFAEPFLNFLEMKPGDTDVVHLSFFQFSVTDANSYYYFLDWMAANPLNPAVPPSIDDRLVQVEASDTNGDLKTDEWVMTPVADGLNVAWLYRLIPGKGNVRNTYCDLGRYDMAFQITLKRVS